MIVNVRVPRGRNSASKSIHSLFHIIVFTARADYKLHVSHTTNSDDELTIKDTRFRLVTVTIVPRLLQERQSRLSSKDSVYSLRVLLHRGQHPRLQYKWYMWYQGQPWRQTSPCLQGLCLLQETVFSRRRLRVYMQLHPHQLQSGA